MQENTSFFHLHFQHLHCQRGTGLSFIQGDGHRPTSAYGIVRHPQYIGIFLAVLGQLIHWPTIPTLALAPVIVWAYVRLARNEERELVERFGDQYRAYQRRVPMFWPRGGEWRRVFRLPVGARARPRESTTETHPDPLSHLGPVYGSEA